MKNFRRLASIISLALAFLFLATAPRCGTDKTGGCNCAPTKGCNCTSPDSVPIEDGPDEEVTKETSYRPVEIRETENLRFFFPNFSKVDLVCGTMPDKRKDTDVILTCAAAYTAECLNKFEHSNIIGNHVSGGKLYAGAKSHSYRGAFAFYVYNILKRDHRNN